MRNQKAKFQEKHEENFKTILPKFYHFDVKHL